MTADLRPRAEGLASALPPLLVAAERIAATVAAGVHGRRRIGVGDAFWQYRRYLPGDSMARIDWRPSAKSDNLYVREREWEAAESVWIWRDASASMAYRSSTSVETKAERASLLALALASLLTRGGERVALLGSPLNPATGRAGLTRFAEILEQMSAEEGPSLPPPVPLPAYGRIVLIGDFLSAPEDIAACMARFSAGGKRGHLLQILDPAEEELPFTGRCELIEPETSARLMLGRAESLADAYRARLTAHREAIGLSARAAGWTFSHHSTGRPPQPALLALYAALAGPRAMQGRGAI